MNAGGEEEILEHIRADRAPYQFGPRGFIARIRELAETTTAEDPPRGGEQVGDRGTYTYDEDGRLVKTSQSTGCPGCTSVFDWSYEDDVLTLEVYEDGGDYPTWDAVDRAITRVFDAGVFRRVE